MRSAPAHAGKLPGWERLAFALVFALMASFVVAVTVTAAKTGIGIGSVAGGSPSSDGFAVGPLAATPDSVRAGKAGPAGHHRHSPSGGAAAARQAALDSRLAAALHPVMAGDGGRVAVGIIDISTGARALYDGLGRFHTARIETADVLAALLLERQSTQLTSQEAAVAVPMIEDSGTDASVALYAMVDGNAGLADANAALKLTHTVIGPPGHWSRTSTTVLDQLQLLTDLVSARSPLTATSRDYELGLMENVASGAAWGVSAAASAGTRCAVISGSVRGRVLWVTNSVGVVDHDGQQLLIVVLAKDQPSRATGIAVDSAAAAAAAAVMTEAA